MLFSWILSFATAATLVQPITMSTAEDTATSVTMVETDARSTTALLFRVKRQPRIGVVTVDKGGVLTLTPQPNSNGVDSVDVEVRRAAVRQLLTVPITISAVNDPPQVEPVALHTAEDSPIRLALQWRDIDKDRVVFRIATAAAKGLAAIDAAGRLSYAPQADANGNDTFVVEVDDGTAATQVSVDVTIDAVNDPPLTSPSNLRTDQDTVASLSLTAVDVDGDVLTWSIAQQPRHGSAKIDRSSGRLEFTPAANWYGDDKVSVSINDASSTTSMVVPLLVAHVNHAPVVEAMTLATPEGTSVSGRLITRDRDRDSLTFALGTAPTQGEASVDARGRVTYTPTLDNNGSDHFSVVVSDSRGEPDGKAEAQVDVVIAPVNDAPLLPTQTLSGAEDVDGSFTLSASDVDDDAGALTWAIATAPAHGTATIDQGGRLLFKPQKNWHGNDSVKVSVKDRSTSTSTTFPIFFSAQNDAPLVQPLALVTKEDQRVKGTLVVSDIDSVDGDTLSFAIGTAPQHGSATVDATGVVGYEGTKDQNGSDHFTVVVSDSSGQPEGRLEARVDIVVAAANDAPLLPTQTLNGAEDVDGSFALSASDADGDALTWAIATAPAHGTATIDQEGHLLLTPQKNWHGNDSVQVNVKDRSSSTATTFPILFTAQNDAPVTQPLALQTKEDQSVKGTLVVSDIDSVDGDTLTFAIGTAPQKGTATVDAKGRVGYEGAKDQNGSDHFTVVVSDSSGQPEGRLEAAVDVVVAAVNDPPLLPTQTLNGAEDVDGSFALSASDPDGDALTWAIVTAPAHGTATIDQGGRLLLKPQKNWHGNDSVQVSVKDRSTSTANTLPISFTAQNDAPVVQPLALMTKEDQSVKGTLVVSDIDSVDGDTLSFAIGTAPQHGAATVDAKGLVGYEGAKDQHGSDSFTVIVSDGSGGPEGRLEAQVNVVIAPVNDPPLLPTQTLNGAEDVDGSFTLSGSDVDGDTLTWAIASAPAHGTATIDQGGRLLLKPQKNWHGTDSVQVSIKDRSTSTSTTLPISFTAQNDAPVVRPLALLTNEDQSVKGTLVASDIDSVDGDALTFAIGTPPQHGSATVDAKGVVGYEGAKDSNGSDRFTVVVSDSSGQPEGRIEAQVDVVVAAVNDPPLLPTQTLNGAEDVDGTFTLSASDVDGDTLAWAIARAPAHGTATIDQGGRLRLKPQTNWHGTDSVQVSIKDRSTSTSTTLPISFTAQNDAPVVRPLALSTNEDQSVKGTLVASDIDSVDGDALTFAIGTPPQRGAATVDAKGVVGYEGAKDSNGSDRFTVVVSDNSGRPEGRIEAQVDVVVAAVNDPPLLSTQTLNGAEDVDGTFTLSASDVDGDTLAWAIASAPAHGTATIDQGGRLRLKPQKNWHGTDSVQVSIKDRSSSTSTTLPISFAAQNDAPVVRPLALLTNEDQSVKGTIVASDVDSVDGDALSFAIGTAPQHGAATVDAKGVVVYQGAKDSNGGDHFTVIVNDSSGEPEGRLEAAVDVVVAPVNDAPLLPAQALKGAEDSLVAGQLRASDIDGDALVFALVKGPTGAVVDKAGALSWTPPADFHGVETFVVEVDDGKLKARADTVVTVTPVNDAPTMKSRSLSTTEDNSASMQLQANDIDGDRLIFRIAQAGSKGDALVDASSGLLTYAPHADVWGDDVVVVAADDGTSSIEASLKVSISAVNDSPRTSKTVWAVQEDTDSETRLPGIDVDGDRLTFSLRAQPQLGTARLIDPTTGSVAFAPRQNENGADELQFEVSDGVSTVAGVLSMSIIAEDDAPAAAPLVLQALEDQPTTGTVAMTDVDGDAVNLTVVGNPKDAVVQIDDAARGVLTVVPAHDFNGVIVFSVAAVESGAKRLSSPVVEVRVTVAPVNDAPVAREQSRTTAEDMTVSEDLLASDVDGDELSYRVKKGPTLGSVVVDPVSGRFVYTPRKNVFGEDSFTFVVADAALSSSEKVWLRLNPVDDRPVAVDGQLTSPRAGRVTGKLLGRDPEGATLRFRLLSQPSFGKATLLDERTGAYSFTPEGGKTFGTTSFSFVVAAGGQTSMPAVITIDVN